MRMKLLVAALATSIASFCAAAESGADRLQVGLFKQESSLGNMSGEPTISSVEWSDGDLRVRLTQAAPCGSYIPINPVWEKAGTTIVLRFNWHAMSEVDPAKLCLKYVEAWVFRVPKASYIVSVSDSVPRFVARDRKAN
jgi:hypothetical protein